MSSASIKDETPPAGGSSIENRVLQILTAPPFASETPSPSPPPTTTDAAAATIPVAPAMIPRPHGFLVPPAATASPRSSPPAPLPARDPVPSTTVTLASLLNEKRSLLARFEAKFDEKILSHHKVLLEGQRQSLKAQHESKAADEVGRLREEAETLRDELEEQKFSHEVEMNVQRKRAEKAEEELRRRGGVARVSVRLEGRVEELEEKLSKEKRLRIDQLKSLEQLHFAEFREIEKKHAEFVSHLVASYQNEIKVLKAKASAVAKSKEKSSERHEAATALSSLAAPPPAATATAEETRNPKQEKIDDCGSASAAATADVDSLAVTVAIQMEPGPLPHAMKDAGNESRTRGKKKRDIISSPVHAAASEVVSDSGSASGDEPPRKKGKSRRGPAGGTLREAGASPRLPEKRKMLTGEVKDYLRAWMMSPEHCDHPYPTPKEKSTIMADTGIGFQELNNWFVNNRKRYWLNEVKPRIAEIKGRTGESQNLILNPGT